MRDACYPRHAARAGLPRGRADASEAEEFTTVLRTAAAGGMQTGEFSTFFMRVVPGWEQQDELQRPLMVLLSDWAEETTSESRSAMTAAVRRVLVTLREMPADRGLPVMVVVRYFVPPDVAAGGAVIVTPEVRPP